MVKQASNVRKRLRRFLTADPGRFAGGSAVSDPLGLLAVERERQQSAVLAPGPARPQTGNLAGGFTGSTSRLQRDADSSTNLLSKTARLPAHLAGCRTRGLMPTITVGRKTAQTSRSTTKITAPASPWC